MQAEGEQVEHGQESHGRKRLHRTDRTGNHQEDEERDQVQLEDSSENGASNCSLVAPEGNSRGHYMTRSKAGPGVKLHTSGHAGRKRVYEDAFDPPDKPGTGGLDQPAGVNAAAAVAAAAVVAADAHEAKAKWLSGELAKLEDQLAELNKAYTQVKDELLNCQDEAYSAKLAANRYKARLRKAQDDIAPVTEAASKATAAAAARAQEVEALKLRVVHLEHELNAKNQQLKALSEQQLQQVAELTSVKMLLTRRDMEMVVLKRTIEQLRLQVRHEQQQAEQARAGGQPQTEQAAPRPGPGAGAPPHQAQQQVPNTWAHRAAQQQQQREARHQYQHQHPQPQQQQQQQYYAHQQYWNQYGAGFAYPQHQQRQQQQQQHEAESGYRPQDAQRPSGAAPPPSADMPQHQHQQNPPPGQPPTPPPSALGQFPDLVAEPPALGPGTSIAVLKSYLMQAGVSEAQMSGMEKNDILELAQRKGGAWEIRRLLACAAAATDIPNGQHAAFAAAFRYQPTQAAVQALYKELKVKVHPDKNHGDATATQAFQFLQQAYNGYHSRLPA